MPSPEDNANTVTRYLELVSKAQPDEVAALYADDATLEDPVGSEVHIGRPAIRGFYSSIENIKAETEIGTLRALGNEVAFFWTMTVDLGNDARVRMEIISVMTFDDEGKIASMKAYWGPENVEQL
ncbi:nuclear transport factor 2 family protein [Mycobacterium sp. MMS18-G62]